MWNRKPRSDAEREAEIIRLSARRDKLLAAAPRQARMRRWVLPMMLAIVGWTVVRIALDPDTPNRLIALGFFGLFFIGLAIATWGAWRHQIDENDRWGTADHLPYDGPSPRELQKKIDDLRA